MRPVFAIAIGIQLALLTGLLAWSWLFDRAPSIREIAMSLPDPLLEAQHQEASKAMALRDNRREARNWIMARDRGVSEASSELKVRQRLFAIAKDETRPMQERRMALELGIRALDDLHYYELDAFWEDHLMAMPLRELMFDDLLSRPFDQILLTCLEVAQNGNDPLKHRAAKLLKVYTRDDKIVSFEDSNLPQELPLN